MTKVQDVIDYALGSCNSSAGVANALDIEEDEVLDLMIEAQIDWCQSCGWVYGTEDLEECNGDLVCYHCVEDALPD